jgi:hypothetical protein
MSTEPLGQRFSFVYTVRGRPAADSKKARFRIAKLAHELCPEPKFSRNGRTFDFAKAAKNHLENELGLIFDTWFNGVRYTSWQQFFDKITLEEFLDSITILAGHLGGTGRSAEYLRGVTRILEQENLAYRIDSKGGVHPLIDAAFSGVQQLAVGGLEGLRYSATAALVSSIDGALLSSPPDYKDAIRCTFGACENLFKLMYNVPRLDARTAGDKIGQDQQRLYSGRKALSGASAKMVESFKGWIDAAHFYRHEEGVEEPQQPSEEVAILMISQGLGYVRWLAMLDKLRAGS